MDLDIRKGLEYSRGIRSLAMPPVSPALVAAATKTHTYWVNRQNPSAEELGVLANSSGETLIDLVALLSYVRLASRASPGAAHSSEYFQTERT
jgi:hypothetical protein